MYEYLHLDNLARSSALDSLFLIGKNLKATLIKCWVNYHLFMQ